MGAKSDDGKNQHIAVEKQAKKEDLDEDYRESFIDAVKESGSCRYGVVDYQNKLLFVSWVPDTAKPKDKMVYASIKEAFIESLWNRGQDSVHRRFGTEHGNDCGTDKVQCVMAPPWNGASRSPPTLDETHSDALSLF